MTDDPQQPQGSPPISLTQDTEPDDLPPLPLFAELAPPDAEAIDAHYVQYIGEGAMVWHEPVSLGGLHVDVYVFPSTPQRPFVTFATSGMSARPMYTPPEAKNEKYCELIMLLPPQWPIPTAFTVADPSDPSVRQWYWPVSMLKSLAHFPIEFKSWLWHGHTIPNGEPPRPFTPDTGLSCLMLGDSIVFADPFHTLNLPHRSIGFWNVMMLYREEMEYKLKYGIDALYERFNAARISPLINFRRPNACL